MPASKEMDMRQADIFLESLEGMPQLQGQHFEGSSGFSSSRGRRFSSEWVVVIFLNLYLYFVLINQDLSFSHLVV